MEIHLIKRRYESLATLKLTINDTLESLFKELLEIEMLQGEKTILSDGQIEYNIVIHDFNKADLIREFCLKIISQSHEINLS